MSNRLLLVDGHAYAYRAFHAIRSLNAPDGSPTNAIYGFVKMVQKMVGALKPTHVLVLWDAGLAAERSAALPEYKANRAPTPEALEAQFPQIEGWLTAAGFSQHSEDGTEADDWIGTYARRAEAAGWQVIIASADKDFLQLVNDRIGILNPNDKSEKIWAPADVVAKTGVAPEQVADWLALVGDSVDNIPGVPGVGPKTAADLLRRFGSVDQIYARLAEIKSDSQRTALAGASDAVRRNQLMVRLHETKAGGPGLEGLTPGVADLPALRLLYSRWGFRSLLAEVGGAEGTPVQGSLL
ncbi:MAG: 5'-3' exonuclease [Verrucomicrobia bacterium]|nr:5'-3' exonuclease [Verrucomicrobiota bacterium]